MNRKILRLAKKLNKFTLDDLVITLEEDSAVVEKELELLLTSGQVKKTEDGFYIYSDKVKKYKSKNKKFIPKNNPNIIVFSDEEVQKFLEERNTSEAYKNSSKFIRNMIDKYIFLLKEINGIYIKKPDIAKYIYNKWNIEHPEMKTSIDMFLRTRKKLKEFGIEGLIPVNKKYSRQNSSVNENLYKKFKDYLFENRGKSLKYNYKNFRANYFIQNPDTEDSEFPSYGIMLTRIKKDILIFNDQQLSEIYQPRSKADNKEPKRFGFKAFKGAANDYIKYLEKEKKIAKSTLTGYKNLIIYQLIPFFEKYRVEEVTEEVIEQYRASRDEKQASSIDTHKGILLVKRIVNMYSPEGYITPKNSSTNSEIKLRILTKKEIINILQLAKEHYRDFYPLILTALTTGMTRGEILALQWDKINWQKNKILIKCTLAQGEILKHTARGAIREIDVPKSHLNILKNWKKKCPKSEFVFPDKNGKYQNAEEMIKYKFNPLIEKAGIDEINFMSLRDTYAVLLIEQNLPLTYIQQQLGHTFVRDTADRYKNLLDKNRPDSLDFLNSMF